jgi:hypothetical protein
VVHATPATCGEPAAPVAGGLVAGGAVADGGALTAEDPDAAGVPEDELAQAAVSRAAEPRTNKPANCRMPFIIASIL